MTKLDEFLSRYDAKGTVQSYRTNLKTFFTYVNKTPDEYVSRKQDYENDLRHYWSWLRANMPSRCTRNSRINTIKTFLLVNNIELSQSFWKGLRTSAKDKGSRPATLDFAPSQTQIKKILKHSDPLGRAITLMLCSSGMRIGELIQLIPDDLQLDNDPPRIDIRAETTKTQTSRYVFISYEARDALKTWLEPSQKGGKSERQLWLESIQKRLKNIQCFKKDPNDPRIFPMSAVSVRRLWNDMLDKAGMAQRDHNTKVKYHQYHLHTLRKFFRTNLLPKIEGGTDVVEALLGHEAYQTIAYRRYNMEQMGAMYKEAMHAVMITEATPDMVELNDKIQEKDQQIQNLQKQIDELKMKYLEKLVEKHEKTLNGN